MTGALRWDRRRMVRFLTITAVLTVALFGGARLFFGRALHNAYAKDKVLAGMHLLHEPVPAVVHKAPFAPGASPETGARLDIIRRRGVLTVGYTARLAAVCLLQRCGRSRRVRRRARASPRRRSSASDSSSSRSTASAQPIRSTPANATSSCQVSRSRRCGRAGCSSRRPMWTRRWRLSCRMGSRNEFSSWDQLRLRPDLRLGIPDIPYYVQKMRERLPRSN